MVASETSIVSWLKGGITETVALTRLLTHLGLPTSPPHLGREA